MLGVAVATTAALAGCPLFGSGFSTNQRVDTLPVASDSNAIVRSIGLDDGFHADFGSGLWEGRPIGIPYTVVNRKTRRWRVRFDYADESDRVRYPIPRGVKIEGGGDRHALLVDRSACKLYELYALRRAGSGLDAPARARPGTCGTRRCARAAGRRRTRPGCRSCRCSRGPARQPADPPRAAGDGRPRPAARSRSRRATSPPTTTTRRSRGWASGCA